MINQIISNYKVSMESVYKDTQDLFIKMPWESKEFYVQWLAQTFFMVSHTPRLICLAAARFNTEEDFLHRKMISHFGDEDEHEYVLLDDLKQLGFDIKQFTETPETSVIVQQLYYQIDRIHPVAIFGRILFLEMLSAELDSSFWDKISNHYTADQTRFMKIHLEEDITHVQKAIQILGEIDESQHKIIGDSFYLTGYLYQQFLTGLNNSIKTENKSNFIQSAS